MLDECPEVRPVTGDQEMGQLVHQDVVDTQAGIVWSRWDSRMVPSEGVQDPQRVFWLVTHLTLTGLARPPR